MDQKEVHIFFANKEIVIYNDSIDVILNDILSQL